MVANDTVSVIKMRACSSREEYEEGEPEGLTLALPEVH